ncbi:alpha-amylase family glycosyl hydrolase, partial [Streptomyces scabiei]|uniref:alpha-amylase family glycosyl hydrolase n=1 Tax=Streptomyces scabiei TaxID=1930 RepID=UPI0029A0A461
MSYPSPDSSRDPGPVSPRPPPPGRGAHAPPRLPGYWIPRFPQGHPEFGTKKDLETLSSQAHAKGMKVFFDVIV